MLRGISLPSRLPPQFWCLALLALVLSLVQLSSKSIWYDEALSLNFAQQELRLLTGNDCLFRPLYFFLLRCWTSLAGYGEFPARLLSVIFSVASLYPLFRIGQRLSDSHTALLAVLLFTLSPWRIILSQQVRNYSLFTLLGLLSVYYFLRIISQDRETNLLRLYFLSSLLFLYTHPLGIFLVITQNMFFLWHQRGQAGNTTWFKWQAALAVSLLPLLVLSQLETVQSQFGSIPRFSPSLMPLFHTLEAFTYGGPFLAQGGFSLPIEGPLLLAERLLVILVAGSCCLVLARTTTPGNDKVSAVHFSLTWALLPMVMLFTLSLFKPALFQTRYLSYGHPAFILLFCLTLARISRQRVRLALLISLAAGMTLFLFTYYTPAEKEQFLSWRETAAFLRDDFQEQDAILFIPSEQVTPFWYYFEKDAAKPLATVGTGRKGQVWFREGKWRQNISFAGHPVLSIPFHTVFYQDHQEMKTSVETLLDRRLPEGQERLWLVLSPGWIGRTRAQQILDELYRRFRITAHRSFDFDGVEVYSLRRKIGKADRALPENSLFNSTN